jgi:fucose permease
MEQRLQPQQQHDKLQDLLAVLLSQEVEHVLGTSQPLSIIKYVNQTQLRHIIAALSTVSLVEKVVLEVEGSAKEMQEEQFVIIFHKTVQQLVQPFVAIETLVHVLFQVLVELQALTTESALNTLNHQQQHSALVQKP